MTHHLKDFYDKALCGLSHAYYYRQLFFGVVLAAFLSLPILAADDGAGTPWSFIIFLLVSIPLYPYARCVYESIVEFIIGENGFIFPLPIFILVKVITMMLCFAFSIFIAPLGLGYLYLRQRKMATVIEE